MERDLESERIGLVGEQQFQLFCAQAGLICNKSTVDVMGWDFIVEFSSACSSRERSTSSNPRSVSNFAPWGASSFSDGQQAGGAFDFGKLAHSSHSAAIG
ncbi:hypothetical protein [Bradyrhizobium glycinis]|uniref:hypothetical protein n=1 Tax=Bradyrhizobium glycinis TaxID=2751812 RepID=UPI0018D8F55A|nr:hypothetical protein [Bradyrhizobium glycinis]MBH5371554.1 hypothetical protein [Bradyrhizobium glycinis]